MQERSLDESLQLARQLIDRVPSMLAYYDATLCCRFANASYTRWLGVPADAAIGSPMDRLLGAERFAKRQSRVLEVLAGRPQVFEDVSTTLDGSARHLLVNYLPDEASGRVRGFVVEVTDITPLHDAEAALRNSERRFRTLSESSPLGVYFADVTGRRVYTNTRWQEIYGLSADEGMGDGWTRALHPDDRGRVVAAWKDMATNGGELEMEFRIVRHGSEARDLRTRARPVRDDHGEVIGFVGALEDITDRNLAESRLRASEAFLDRTGRIAGVGGWEVELATQKVTWSQHTRRIHEVDADYQPVFLNSHRFYPVDAWRRLISAVQRALGDGTAWDLELPFTTAKGRLLWVRIFGEVEYQDGVPVRLAGAFQDITEHRKHRSELLREQEMRLESERHAAELDRLLKERGEMLDVLAHEVRQPLNNASAALQSAAAVVEELHEQPASGRLARAQSVLGAVLASIDNTLAVATLLARPEPMRRVDADIDTLLDVTIADIAPEARRRIRIDRATRTRTASMDMSLMRLALRNLLSNALGCSPAGSTVSIRISDSDDPLALVIEVIDQGPGVAALVVEHLFERGSKRPEPEAQPGGMGLGLYIVRRVMELHSGQADLTANGPTGATFRLVLTQPIDD